MTKLKTRFTVRLSDSEREKLQYITAAKNASFQGDLFHTVLTPSDVIRGCIHDVYERMTAAKKGGDQ